MSDHDEVPDLSPEAKRFLERHERTGEPPAAGLARGQQRIAALTQGVAPSRLRKRRPLLPPEVTAAAAVVAIVLGVQVLYLALRPAPEPVVLSPRAPVTRESKVAMPQVEEPTDLDAKALLGAWRLGDLEGANQLSLTDCVSHSCRLIASDVLRAVVLARRLDTLSPGELDELGLLDAKLAEGRSTVLGRRVAQRQNGMRASTPLSPDARAEAEGLYAEAREERQARNYERAVVRLEKCIKIAPAYHPCYRGLGSAFAAIAARDQSAYDMEKARRYYERFLDVAPPDDEYVPKVQAILDAASSKPQARDVTVAPAEVTITVGSAEEIAFDRDIARLAVGDPSVADISVTGARKVRVVAMSPGKTTLLTWFSTGERESRLLIVRPARDLNPNVFADAERAKASGDWVRATELARAVLLSDQNHSGALRLLLEARVRAREAYLRGYQLRETNPDEALEQFRYVVSITEDGDEWHEKAMSRVGELERGPNAP